MPIVGWVNVYPLFEEMFSSAHGKKVEMIRSRVPKLELSLSCGPRLVDL